MNLKQNRKIQFVLNVCNISTCFPSVAWDVKPQVKAIKNFMVSTENSLSCLSAWQEAPAKISRVMHALRQPANSQFSVVTD
jgi:hypothetical protein